MRAALSGVIGLITGALLGLLAAFVFVYVWLEFGLPRWTIDPKSLDMLLICSVIGLISGGVAGAMRFVRYDRRRPGARLPMIGAACLAAITVLAIAAIGS